jgi:integrase
VQLPKQLTQYIDQYRSQLLPAITGALNPYLFPNKSTGHKAQETLSQQIKETVKKYTGLDLTGHQFRHLGGKFFLEENPGQYEFVRQLLGHKHIKTTTAFYTGMNTVEATRVFDDVILKKRQRLSEKSSQSDVQDDES